MLISRIFFLHKGDYRLAWEKYFNKKFNVHFFVSTKKRTKENDPKRKWLIDVMMCRCADVMMWWCELLTCHAELVSASRFKGLLIRWLWRNDNWICIEYWIFIFPIKQNKEKISTRLLTFISLYRQRNEPKKATRNKCFYPLCSPIFCFSDPYKSKAFDASEKQKSQPSGRDFALRRVRDSNPWYPWRVQRFSRPPRSTTPATLRDKNRKNKGFSK